MILHESERLDFSRPPTSRGIPKRVWFVLYFGLVAIFIMGYLSVIMSGYGHMWPQEKTTLTTMTPNCSSSNSQECQKNIKTK